MQQAPFKLEKERDLGEIITDTFAFIRINFSALKEVFISSILPIMLISVAAGVYYQYATQELTSNSFLLNSNAFEFVSSFTAVLLPGLLSILAALFFYVISYIAILGSIKSYKQSGEIKVEFVKNEIKSFFWSMTGLFVIAFLMLVFGIMLCFIPFVYLIVPVSIMFPILIFENRSVGDSISHAFNLIKENYWATLGTLIVFFLIIALASGIFQIPIFIYSMFSTITKLEGGNLDLDTLVETDWILLSLTAFGSIGSSILSLVYIVVAALIYFDLNEKHNLTGTIQDIDSIGSN